jgi:hypothetical protein
VDGIKVVHITQICSNIPAPEGVRCAERFAAALHSQRVDLRSWDVATGPADPQGLRLAPVNTRLWPVDNGQLLECNRTGYNWSS